MIEAPSKVSQRSWVDEVAARSTSALSIQVGQKGTYGGKQLGDLFVLLALRIQRYQLAGVLEKRLATNKNRTCAYKRTHVLHDVSRVSDAPLRPLSRIV